MDLDPESLSVKRAERFGVSLSGLWRRPPWDGGDRGAIRWAADAGVRCVELDASMPGLRPRGLDRSARRDLAAQVRRSDLLISGIDLPIPAAHFVSSAEADRAIAATVAAIELMADLAGVSIGRGYVSVTLPADEGDGRSGSYLSPLREASERFGVPLADAAWPAWGGAVAFDCAGVQAAGDDLTASVAGVATRAVVVRLADLAGAGRVAVGEGGLDLDGLKAISWTLMPKVPVLAHLAGLERPDRGLASAKASWLEYGAG